MTTQLIPGVLAFGLAALLPAAAQDPAPADAPTDPAAIKADASYGLGYRTGDQLSNFGIGADDVDRDTFVQGLLDAFAKKDPAFSDERIGAAMDALGKIIEKREQDLAAKNLADGQAFLAENGKREGVVTTDSGLQYEILEKGGEEKYAAPQEGEPDKQFLVHYKGTLTDGTQFDASPEGEPVPMGLDVIDGFKEALTAMPVGAKWKLFIPSELAYGDSRRSADIGPNSVLVFELHLVGIEDAPTHPGLPFAMPDEE